MQHIVITGGTRGIGKSLAIEFLRAGCRVSFSGRNRERIDLAVSELKRISGSDACHGFVCDVCKPTDMEALWEKASATHTIDVWINNAGISHASQRFHLMKDSEVKKVLSTNIDGTMTIGTISEIEGIFCFTPRETDGFILETGAVFDTMYVCVRREINGESVVYFERFNS